jgi:hypothetical protein
MKAGCFSQHARRQPNQCQLPLGCPHNATDPLPRNPELLRDFGSRKGLGAAQSEVEADDLFLLRTQVLSQQRREAIQIHNHLESSISDCHAIRHYSGSPRSPGVLLEPDLDKNYSISKTQFPFWKGHPRPCACSWGVGAKGEGEC